MGDWTPCSPWQTCLGHQQRQALSPVRHRKPFPFTCKIKPLILFMLIFLSLLRNRCKKNKSGRVEKGWETAVHSGSAVEHSLEHGLLKPTTFAFYQTSLKGYRHVGKDGYKSSWSLIKSGRPPGSKHVIKTLWIKTLFSIVNRTPSSAGSWQQN